MPSPWQWQPSHCSGYLLTSVCDLPMRESPSLFPAYLVHFKSHKYSFCPILFFFPVKIFSSIKVSLSPSTTWEWHSQKISDKVVLSYHLVTMVVQLHLPLLCKSPYTPGENESNLLSSCRVTCKAEKGGALLCDCERMCMNKMPQWQHEHKMVRFVENALFAATGQMTDVIICADECQVESGNSDCVGKERELPLCDGMNVWNAFYNSW